MKKRSAFSIIFKADIGRGSLSEISLGFGIWGMICFLLRYFGQLPKSGQLLELPPVERDNH